ncbi:MAG TPA: hypothetical protein VEL11_03605, partial [Candidatus Bathyarchaeia archaeon]|nr:hypothetical protein [Candidatus Bathyarchaeia archaeon]
SQSSEIVSLVSQAGFQHYNIWLPDKQDGALPHNKNPKDNLKLSFNILDSYWQNIQMSLS